MWGCAASHAQIEGEMGWMGSVGIWEVNPGLRCWNFNPESPKLEGD